MRLSRAPRPALSVVVRRELGSTDGHPGCSVGVVDGGSAGGAGRVRHAGRAASAESGGQVPLRLTRRGRRVIAGLSIAFGMSVAAATVAIESGEAGGGLELAGSATIVVQSGDTLWSIAGEIAPEEDRRAVVDALLDVNGLSGVDLVPGQVLELP
ncbi:LysM peptidoglycan-binding domain-containing protein [Modestobacter sp. VKM Ac-2984]|uniref:LysM peptidoglycan-binding domain-containing protein n=1 Tax=Modestobacter sp. VKM Ac-2984 TaxID=3004138 RepID=UPI0022AB1267|nr:LysM peptidoglycan-binding domain-containing protein [Modestobacter sp. VKM Ac-2984]MCZ2818039.1 LysM peptidoglycan-binding domain-containing protein [Modestobacter sp. VKM Ac-2984]